MIEFSEFRKLILLDTTRANFSVVLKWDPFISDIEISKNVKFQYPGRDDDDLSLSVELISFCLLNIDNDEFAFESFWNICGW